MPAWLRLATFFPGLVMGVLRHRNGFVLFAIVYHALCNVWVVWWAPLPLWYALPPGYPYPRE